MSERSPVYLALTRSSTMLGLPYGYFVVFLLLCAIPAMWATTFFALGFVLGWGGGVYGVLRFFASRDDKALQSAFIGFRVAPPTQSRKFFGGDSYGA